MDLLNLRTKGGNTPLIWAAKRNKPKIVGVLLRAGADAKLTDQFGHTPLSIAHGRAEHVFKFHGVTEYTEH